MDTTDAGHAETDSGIKARVSEPHGRWDHPHLSVMVPKGRTMCNILQGQLTPETAAGLRGGAEPSISTCASIFDLVSEAAAEIGVDVDELAEQYD